MKRILVPVGCRSDEGLSAPIIKRLKEHFDVDVLQLTPQDFGASYHLVTDRLYWCPYDLVFITGDRVEMCAAAAAAFHTRVKVAHYYAGVVNDPITTFDDVDRHCITLWSDIQFCEDACSLMQVESLLYAFKESNAHIVGISHLDDLEIDESKVPWVMENGTPLNVPEPYDLILSNREPLSNGNMVKYVQERYTIEIGGNPDGDLGKLPWSDEYYQNLPRPQFLGLLKNCRRFITNSSAAIYEAPHFLKPEQIVMVGDRNKNRPKGPFKTGASDKIVEILKEYLK